MMLSPTSMETLMTIASALWVLVTIVAVVAALWLITVLRSDPRVELGERLARGEIDIEQYRIELAGLRG